MARELKSVLVTGARGALGSAVVERFVAAGCQVVATDLAAGEPRPGVTWVPMKLSDPKAVREGMKAISIDGLVHCAGGFRYGKIEELKDEDFEFLMDANVRSTFFLVRELLAGMKVRNFGRITLVSSKATLDPGAGMGPYCASKAAINMLVGALAHEVKKLDINVNAVMPTTIDTPANRRDMPTADFSTWVPLKELADIIFGLMQPWGRTIHGALIPVSGRV